MELLKLIQELEDIVNGGTGVPATGKILVDKDKVLNTINQIRLAIPEDIRESQDLLQMRENLINQALNEARQIRSASEAEAETRIGDSEITKEAKKSSDDIIQYANAKALAIIHEADSAATNRALEADNYSQATLLKLEEDLSQVLTTIRHGIEMMETNKQPSV